MKRVLPGCMALIASAAWGGILDPGPYVSCVTENSVVVSWMTDSDTSANSIDYGPTSAYGNSAVAYQSVVATEDTGTYYVHSSKLTGLSADTVYCYCAVSDGWTSDNTGAGWTVRTFPPAGTQDFSFIVYGDNRYGGDYDSDPLWHEKVMRGIEKENSRLLLNVGDFVSTSNRIIEWSGDHPSSGDPQGEFFRIVGGRFELMQSVWIALCKGNHEVMGDHPDLYDKVFENPYDGNGMGGNVSEDYFAFDYANARIISLNHNGSEGFNRADLANDEQYNWLVSELEAASTAGKWIFVMVHQPPLIPDTNSWSKHGDGYMFTLQEYIVPLFEQYGVNMVFAGHNHVYVRWEKALHFKGRDAAPPVVEEVDDGVRYLIQGTGTKDLHEVDSDTDGVVETYVCDKSGTDGQHAPWTADDNLAKYDLDVYACGGDLNRDPLPAYTIVSVSGDTCTVTTKGMYNANWSGDTGTTEGTVIDTASFSRAGGAGDDGGGSCGEGGCGVCDPVVALVLAWVVAVRAGWKK